VAHGQPSNPVGGPRAIRAQPDAESFRDAAHLDALVNEAQNLVDAAITGHP
jgi:hypothetical protein